MRPHRWLALVVLVALTLVGSAGRAEEPRALSLEEVLDSALRTSPLLRAAELERAVASGDLLSAEGGFDATWKTRGTLTPVGYYDSYRVESVIEKPTTLWGSSAFAGYKLGAGRFAIYDGAKQTLDYGEVRAGVNVPLWRNGPTDRRRANLERAELGREIAGLSVAQQRIELRRAATHRYWAWVAAGRRVTIAEQLFQNVADRDALLALRVERGDLPPIERTDNARALEQRRAQLAVARRGLEQSAIELSLYLRDSAGRPLLPPPSRLPVALAEPPPLAPEPMGAELSSAQARRPEPRRFELQERQSRVELGWAKNQLAPGLDLQIAGSQDLGAREPARPDLHRPVLELTLLLEVPIETRATRGRADAATATVARLEQQRRFARDRIEADVTDARSSLATAHERIQAARREVSLAKELESAERTRFEHGDSQLLIVNLREQQTAEAGLREVDALLDYHRAAADGKASRGE